MSKINDDMAKNEISEPETSVVEIKTTVTYKGESLESVVRFDVEALTKLVQTNGGEAANKSLKAVTDQLYSKTNDNIKQLINK
jgi:hypothetical protein